VIIRCDNLSKIYNQGKQNEVHALSNVSMTIDAGEMCAIVGPSGSGKTTLLRMIGCLDTPTDGRCTIADAEGTRKRSLDSRSLALLEPCARVDTSDSDDRVLSRLRNEKIGFVLQDFGLIEDRSVIENIKVPYLLSRRGFQSYSIVSKNAEGTLARSLDSRSLAPLEPRARIESIMSKLGIDQLKNKMASELSGGQKQRVAIARALVNDPEIILADEPTGALDSATSSDVINVFLELNRQGKTVVIVTHNARIAAQCGRILTLNDGELI
jgi:putative ABC transport system ATP-binding protein